MGSDLFLYRLAFRRVGETQFPLGFAPIEDGALLYIPHISHLVCGHPRGGGLPVGSATFNASATPAMTTGPGSLIFGSRTLGLVASQAYLAPTRRLRYQRVPGWGVIKP